MHRIVCGTAARPCWRPAPNTHRASRIAASPHGYRPLEAFEAPYVATSPPHPSPPPPPRGNEATIAILGDLHMQPKDDPLFQQAAEQLTAVVSCPAGRVVQLGDLGGYNDAPGSSACFATANQWLSGLGAPTLLVVGNHDLEGEEFATDEDNLHAWQREFEQPHYWRARLGPVECIGLSSSRYRSNQYSVHEIHIDDTQLAWFAKQLTDIDPATPVVVFSHAPPIGCGLKVLHNVHVKNRCAWLNHSSNPRAITDLVTAHPNVQLWFSGHFHLSHDYARSIGVLGTCAFVSTNVIGSYNRDGLRQSRVLQVDAQGYRLHTLDHDSGALRLDLEHTWGAGAPSPRTPEHPLDQNVQFDTYTTEYAFGTFDETAASCPLPTSGDKACANAFLRTGPTAAIALQGALLVEYDLVTASPIGVVSMEAAVRAWSILAYRSCRMHAQGCRVVLLDASAGALPPEAVHDGSEVAWVALVDAESGVERERVARNAQGGFFRIYQPNKWKKRQRESAAQVPVTAA